MTATSLAPTITPAGITGSDYSDFLAQLKNAIQAIYGSDIYIDPDSQDGQALAIFAQAQYDLSQSLISLFNAYSPSTAQGTALSSVVKINGLTRDSASNSTDTLQVNGVFGTVINGGQVGDNLNQGTVWDLPTTVTIPASGSIEVTITAEDAGNTVFTPGQITQILTPTAGWQSCTNVGPADPGGAIEQDAALRQRQAQSTALPALSSKAALYSAIGNIPGVSEVEVFENLSDTTDSNGLPPHSIAVVVLGGNISTIAQTIALKKAPGTGTYGNISQIVIDQNGIPNTINFSQLQQVTLKVQVSINPFSGFTSVIEQEIQNAVASFINNLSEGETSYLNRLYIPAGLGGTGDGATFVVVAIEQALLGNAFTAADIPALYYQQFICNASDVTVIT